MGRGLKHVWGRGEVHTEFWWGNMRERDIFEDLSVNGRTIGGTKWIDLARDKDRWWALVNAVMNLRVP